MKYNRWLCILDPPSFPLSSFISIMAGVIAQLGHSRVWSRGGGCGHLTVGNDNRYFNVYFGGHQLFTACLTMPLLPFQPVLICVHYSQYNYLY